MRSIEEEFIPALEKINLSDSISLGISLASYVKLYDKRTDAEVQTIEIIEGTILKRLIRHKNFNDEKTLPVVMILSLPINFSMQTSYKLSGAALGERSQGNEMEELGEINDNVEDQSLLQKSNVFDLNREEKPQPPGSNSGALSGTAKGSLFFAFNREKQEFDIKPQKPVRNDDNYIPLEKLVSIKSKINSYIIDIVRKKNVNILFCTDAVPHSLFERLRAMNVICIFSVSKSEAKVVSKITGAEIINSSETLCRLAESSGAENYTGYAQKFHFAQTIDQDEAFHRKVSHLIYLEQSSTVLEDWTSVGCVVQGSSPSQNQSVKQYLRDMLSFMYFNLIEKEVIRFEGKMFRGLSKRAVNVR